MKNLPGIFNDVIGPIMRGPSSSHTAASWRIARTALDMLDDRLDSALIEFAADGAWAPNYREQGTCMGIEGGLLGLDITDEKMKNTMLYLGEEGIEVKYLISTFHTDHANTVRLTLRGKSGKELQVVAVSLGGGSFEIRKVNGLTVTIDGTWHQILISTGKYIDISKNLKYLFPDAEFSDKQKDGESMYELKSSASFYDADIHSLMRIEGINEVLVVNPLMPVISGKRKNLPYTSISSLISYSEKKGMSLGQLGLEYERSMSGLDAEELKSKMQDIIGIIHGSIDIGLKGTYYEDRILPQQSHLIRQSEKNGSIPGSIVNRIISNVTALMESKSSMEVIVAVPTAGSCGTVGGSLLAVAENIKSSKTQLIDAYFAAGLVGAYFGQGPGFSAEEHGCQVECGAAAGMAAAGMVQLMGGTTQQALGAASMAIQNMIGLVCDPVADRVEVPCLGKNVSAAVNAYSSAIMSISGFDAVIPLDQVIQTVSRVSKTMPSCVKCTGKGGLAITDTSRELKKKLEMKAGKA